MSWPLVRRYGVAALIIALIGGIGFVGQSLAQLNDANDHRRAAALAGTETISEDRTQEPKLPFTVGDMQMIGGLCDAEGLKSVMKVQMLSGDRRVGNREFIRLSLAEEGLCRGFEREPMEVRGITYIGEYARLHMWIIKFGDDDFALLSRKKR